MPYHFTGTTEDFATAMRKQRVAEAELREATARDRARLAQFELLAPDDEDAEMEVAGHGRELVPALSLRGHSV